MTPGRSHSQQSSGTPHPQAEHYVLSQNHIFPQEEVKCTLASVIMRWWGLARWNQARPRPPFSAAIIFVFLSLLVSWGLLTVTWTENSKQRLEIGCGDPLNVNRKWHCVGVFSDIPAILELHLCHCSLQWLCSCEGRGYLLQHSLVWSCNWITMFFYASKTKIPAIRRHKVCSYLFAFAEGLFASVSAWLFEHFVYVKHDLTHKIFRMRCFQGKISHVQSDNFSKGQKSRSGVSRRVHTWLQSGATWSQCGSDR